MVDFSQYIDSDDSAVRQRALNRVGELARRYRDLENEAADLERRLKEKNAELRQVQESDLPGALDEAGLTEVKLPTGEKVLVKEDIRVSTTGKYRPAIHAWLKKTGNDNLIEDEVKANFGKGEGARAARLVALIEEMGDVVYARDQWVNAARFKALVAELRATETAEPIPYDELGVFLQRRARLVR